MASDRGREAILSKKPRGAGSPLRTQCGRLALDPMKTAISSLCSGVTATCLLVGTISAQQQEIGYIETFALAEDRAEVLKKLIPGTEDYYYYHTLHFQNERDLKRLDEVLKAWDGRFPKSGLRKRIINREALIKYGDNPEETLAHIRKELGLKFDHQQAGKAEARGIPQRLDQAQISWKAFLQDALRGLNSLRNLKESEFFALLKSGHKLTATQRRELLQRATVPDLPNLINLIAEDLATKESKGFGQYAIHRALTVSQLDALRAKRKEVLRDADYVNLYVSKLRPGADTNPAADPEIRRSFLDRAWKFARDLDPAFNSLKAHLLYQRLLFDYAQGKPNGERFLEYIKLPRQVSYIREAWRKEDQALWRSPANLRSNYVKVTGLGPIGTDQAMVRNYLLHFLRDAKDFKLYAPYIRESFLKEVFAETKIVNGIGDAERWASLLSPSAFQALKERVDLEFDPTNAERFDIDDDVKLKMHIKNVETLIVKVFEVNTLNYYLKYGSEVSTDIDLDGLVTNHERTVKYEEAPARRVARDFAFPEIENRRGVWVVEFIGGSKSSRAVIRKGKLQVLSATTASGELLTVLDEGHQPVSGSAVWLGGRKTVCDEQGRALLPFSNQPGARTPVIEHEGFSSLARIQQPTEHYALSAGIQIDRESLRAGGKSTIAVRPTLTVAGEPISLSQLSNVRLVLISTDLDGVSTTETISDFKIGSDREATHEIRVPNRLAKLAVRLLAKVKVASKGQEELELNDGTSFDLNGQLRTDRVDDLYLSRLQDGFLLELLGRTGEPLSGRNLTVTVKREGFQNNRSFTLQTGARGHIDLGALEEIERVNVRTADGHSRVWYLPNERRTNGSFLHGVAGKPVRVPYVGTLTREAVALLEFSEGGYVADRFEDLKLHEGYLEAKSLGAGDYRLLLKEQGEAITIRMAGGATVNRHVFSPARTLELPRRLPSHLAALAVKDQSLQIAVANANPSTRVHVVATRFLPDYDVFSALAHAPRRGATLGRPGFLPNLYVSGRKIGDEFRYILERRYARKLPGNMLERPEILLNPWAVRDTEAGVETLRQGEAYQREKPGDAAVASRVPAKLAGQARGSGSTRALDFLASGPAQLLNLRPDKAGNIVLDLTAFGDRQHVHVMLVDNDGASYREVALGERDTALRDLRLVKALDPKKHFTEQDAVTLLKKGEVLEIPDLRTARFEVFQDLPSAYRYLLAMREDPVLREFGFLMSWPSLTKDEKRAKYSRYACHELSFFLQRKDPAFFKEVIAPYLKNKRDRTFFDEFLLQLDVDDYLRPFEFNRLNALERVLLGHRTPDRMEVIHRDLRDRFSLRAVDLGRATLTFDGALALRDLDFDKSNLGEAHKFAWKLASPEGAEARLKPGSERGGRQSQGRTRLSLRSKNGKLGAPADAEMEEEQALFELQESIERDGKEVLKKHLEEYRKDRESGSRFYDDYGETVLSGKRAAALYRALETTKEWAESNYYRLPIDAHTFNLIAESQFWIDYAAHGAKEGFGSRHIGEASRNVHESLLALAVLDLPFVAPESKVDIKDAHLTFSAAGNAIAFHREIKEAKMAENRPPLLVSQSYFRHGDRHRIENGQKVDKFVRDEFVAGLVYGSQVVVTNPTSSRQQLDVLVQIPEGAIPVLGHRATATQKIMMEPYTTQRLERMFYFPTVGDYPGYPAHVSRKGEVIAHAEAITFHVVATPSRIDETSWAHLSQWGTEEQVLAYLKEQNLHRTDLKEMAWRCRESADFFKKAVTILNRRGRFDPVIYSYGVHHNQPAVIREYLEVDGRYLATCGNFLESSLVTIDPIGRRSYQHLEYKPLVNNRAHAVGGDRKILNGRVRSQYQQLLSILSQKKNSSSSDQLSLTYYLFLQDRVAEALSTLDGLRADKLPTRLQYDYFRAYAAFYRAEPAEARSIAEGYKTHPVDRWRERFINVIAQADEIQGGEAALVNAENRNQEINKLAADESSLGLSVDGATVTLAYQNIENVEINYYEMDLEFLFSTNPFVSSGSGSFSIVRPNKSDRLQLAADKRQHALQLPEEYRSRNVLVEVLGGGKKKSIAIYSNDLRTDVSERYGILTVRHQKDDRALPATYVKVYALTKSGPKFYKDGYTDLRGKFDYASVSTSDIGDARKFSVLVMNDDHGATVLEAPVPQR